MTISVSQLAPYQGAIVHSLMEIFSLFVNDILFLRQKLFDKFIFIKNHSHLCDPTTMHTRSIIDICVIIASSSKSSPIYYNIIRDRIHLNILSMCHNSLWKKGGLSSITGIKKCIRK
jgi:hypothetical protein